MLSFDSHTLTLHVILCLHSAAPTPSFDHRLSLIPILKPLTYFHIKITFCCPSQELVAQKKN
jgi:hypothetical protein